MVARRDVEVDIEFLPTEVGGRQTGVLSGYRPQLYYDGHDWDALHEYPDVNEVRPGDHDRAYLTCLSPQFHDRKLVPGEAVLFREGNRVVAFGAVTRILALPEAAYRARVEESLELYYRALGSALDHAQSSRDEALCRAELGVALSLRQQIRDQADVPDIQSFLSQQDALSESLASTSDSMTAALKALKAALAG